MFYTIFHVILKRTRRFLVMETIIFVENKAQQINLKITCEHFDGQGLTQRTEELNQQLNTSGKIESFSGFQNEHIYLLLMMQGAIVCAHEENNKKCGIKYCYNPQSNKFTSSEYNKLPQEYIIYDLPKNESYCNNNAFIRIHGTQIKDNHYDFEIKHNALGFESFTITKTDVKQNNKANAQTITYVKQLGGKI